MELDKINVRNLSKTLRCSLIRCANFSMLGTASNLGIRWLRKCPGATLTVWPAFPSFSMLCKCKSKSSIKINIWTDTFPDKKPKNEIFPSHTLTVVRITSNFLYLTPWQAYNNGCIAPSELFKLVSLATIRRRAFLLFWIQAIITTKSPCFKTNQNSVATNTNKTKS